MTKCCPSWANLLKRPFGFQAQSAVNRTNTAHKLFAVPKSAPSCNKCNKFHRPPSSFFIDTSDMFLSRRRNTHAHNTRRASIFSTRLFFRQKLCPLRRQATNRESGYRRRASALRTHRQDKKTRAGAVGRMSHGQAWWNEDSELVVSCDVRLDNGAPKLSSVSYYSFWSGAEIFSYLSGEVHVLRLAASEVWRAPLNWNQCWTKKDRFSWLIDLCIGKVCGLLFKGNFCFSHEGRFYSNTFRPSLSVVLACRKKAHFNSSF